MSLITVSHLTFGYEGSCELVFDDVSFQLDTDWKLGLTGRNGRGKTTLLRLLAGEYTGRGNISSSVQFVYFPCRHVDRQAPAYLAAEQISPGYEWWALVRELSLLDVEEERLYQSFGTLSGGEQTKIMLASLFLEEGRFLLIDEPTDHLDYLGRQAVAKYLNRKKGFLLVSHDRQLLNACTDHTMSINPSEIQIQKGNYDCYQENKQRRDQFELAENQKLQREIRKMSEAAKRTAEWSDRVEATKNGTRLAGLKPDKGYIGAQAARMMKRSKAAQQRRQRALEEKEGLLKNLEFDRDLKLTPLAWRGGRMIEADGLTLFYGERQICQPLTFCIEAGELAALQGSNGCGKSSLLSLLMKRPAPNLRCSGTLRIASGLRISCVLQDTNHLSGSLSQLARCEGIDESRLKAILRYMDLSKAQFEIPLEEFSEGQKKKVLLACSLCQEAHLYLWDEPLNFVDIISRGQLARLLKQAGMTMLLAEHDQAFLDDLSARRIEFSRL